ncbi:hypothetical protein LEP1GSC170_2812 [Leptospira interrogans serovar Bataviae str. HAI135]|nr:hypothetical protein LEP1GSC170_2812 [Leptospira interrogans serovar Bataviae str. HAI135]
MLRSIEIAITNPTIEEDSRINTHFSSVPTRMSLFTCKKYVFLIEKSLPPSTKNVGKLKHNAFLNSALETQHNALYGSRWKLKHNALYESRWKLSTTLSMDRVGN